MGHQTGVARVSFAIGSECPSGRDSQQSSSVTVTETLQNREFYVEVNQSSISP